MSERTEADIAAIALELSQELRDGEEAVCRLAEIQEIIDGIIDKYSSDTLAPIDPWNAFIAIRKVLK